MAENLQKSFVLDRFYELRIHPKKDISFKLKLNNGTAEINGAEMIISKQYLFNTNFYDSLAVFSWSGCTITISFQDLAIVIFSLLFEILILNIISFSKNLLKF
ncbi:Cleavage polyadenylation factor subunit clp1 [Bonamia ostreae]|uniref:Cleavage polyadenylation factor subunit clp1 n=1 Tax=Bonamia ostreae TaxID=126728 RepID=A0ABV2AL13_9EUKA